MKHANWKRAEKLQSTVNVSMPMRNQVTQHLTSYYLYHTSLQAKHI